MEVATRHASGGRILRATDQKRPRTTTLNLRLRASLKLSLLFLCVVMAIGGGAANAADAKRKVIIDDDGFSLMQIMLLESDDVDVLGLTSVSGDVWANRAAAYDLRGLEIIGRTDVPVIQGAT